MPIFELQGPDGSIYEVDGPDEASAVSAFKQMSMGPASFAERFQPAEDAPLQVAQQQGAVANALKPITDYPSTYSQMNRESRELMGEGVGQIGEGGLGNIALGAGKTALGGIGYLTSPINAALRTVVGQPLEEAAGIPKEWTEFGASMLLPIPKRIPTSLGTASKRAVPTVDELKASYVAAKESPEVAAVSIKPEATARTADTITAELGKEWLDPNLAPKTYKVLDKLMAAPDGSTTTMANVDSARRLLGRIAGGGDEDAAAAQMAKKGLDNWLTKMKPDEALAGDVQKAQGIMHGGRADYAAAKISEALDKKITNAELRTGATHSGGNLQNALRQNVVSFLNSDEAKALSTTERAALEAFTKGTFTQNSLRRASKVLGGGGGLGMYVSGAGGFALGGVPGLALPAVGFALNKIGSALTSRQAEKLSEMLRSRSPLAKQMQGPLDDFGKAAQEAEVSPTAKNLSRLMIASRNLSHNLKDAGVSISPNEILRSLYGTKGAGADQEE